MNSNKLNEISIAISKLSDKREILSFLNELLSDSEREVLFKRWQILNMLNNGCTQRDIAHALNVSLCKVTRGAKILKSKNSVIKKYLKGQDNANC